MIGNDEEPNGEAVPITVAVSIKSALSKICDGHLAPPLTLTQVAARTPSEGKERKRERHREAVTGKL